MTTANSIPDPVRRFLSIFQGNESAVTLGHPTTEQKSNGKQIWRYATERRAASVQDVEAHLRGEVSIVQIPIRQDSTCNWGAIDVDDYQGELNPLPLQFLHYDRDHGATLTFHCFRSKSGGIHLFLFFSDPQPANLVRRVLHYAAQTFGYPQAEVFPKQDRLDEGTRCGNGINLPFFGKEEKFAEFEPVLHDSAGIVLDTLVAQGWLPDKVPASSLPLNKDEGEPGYWDDDALLALLQAFNKRIPGFRFRPCRHGYAVPCPGNLPGGWSDGAHHSTKDALLSHETLVWLRNGWPVFRCVHAHCDGGAGAPKKTWKDFTDYYDPLRLFFDFDEWQTRVLNQITDLYLLGSTSCEANLSRPDTEPCGEDQSRGAK